MCWYQIFFLWQLQYLFPVLMVYWYKWCFSSCCADLVALVDHICFRVLRVKETELPITDLLNILITYIINVFNPIYILIHNINIDVNNPNQWLLASDGVWSLWTRRLVKDERTMAFFGGVFSWFEWRFNLRIRSVPGNNTLPRTISAMMQPTDQTSTEKMKWQPPN